MDDYRVILTPDAEEDLAEIKQYISVHLQAPETAMRYLAVLKKDTAKLAFYPEKHQIMKEEPWKQLRLRFLKSKGFLIYYRIDEQTHTVFVLNYIYTRRDQLHALSQKNEFDFTKEE